MTTSALASLSTQLHYLLVEVRDGRIVYSPLTEAWWRRTDSTSVPLAADEVTCLRRLLTTGLVCQVLTITSDGQHQLLHAEARNGANR